MSFLPGLFKALEITRYITLILTTIRDLIFAAENVIDGPGQGQRKKELVTEAVERAARINGISEETIVTAQAELSKIIDDKVKSEIG